MKHNRRHDAYLIGFSVASCGIIVFVACLNRLDGHGSAVDQEEE